jgi:hypothetical protein
MSSLALTAAQRKRKRFWFCVHASCLLIAVVLFADAVVGIIKLPWGEHITVFFYNTLLSKDVLEFLTLIALFVAKQWIKFAELVGSTSFLVAVGRHNLYSADLDEDLIKLWRAAVLGAVVLLAFFLVKPSQPEIPGPPPPRCSQGETLKGGSCVCAPGFIRSDGQCTRQTSGAKLPQTPPSRPKPTAAPSTPTVPPITSAPAPRQPEPCRTVGDMVVCPVDPSRVP